ncbi:MAG TPA: adenylate kinase [Dehalococcoidia bacterium]|nr:adenylate kinase [Dehalococcoidia bacterium]
MLLGPPGAGKGTQAERIKNEFAVGHLSTGDMFREEVAAGTELGQRAKAYMDRGELVPDELTIEMLLQRLFQPEYASGVLFDGFPRTLEQAKALDRALGERGRHIDAVLYLSIPDEEALTRLSGRWICRQCGAVYHERNNPPRHPGRCDQCGGELYQREDDTRETAMRRLERQKPPQDLLAYYREQGKLVEVDGMRSVEEVGGDLVAALR